MPAPPLGPDGKPISPAALSAIFSEPIIEHEVTRARWVPIPEPVREIYRLWRPTPMFRARRLEAAIGTPARIYYKYEGVSAAGSHKPNTAVAQAYLNHTAGVRRLATETGAGQWGSALAMAGQMFGIDVRVFMVRVSYDQKPYRRSMMETWGAEVIASPSSATAPWNCGLFVLARSSASASVSTTGAVCAPVVVPPGAGACAWAAGSANNARAISVNMRFTGTSLPPES